MKNTRHLVLAPFAAALVLLSGCASPCHRFSYHEGLPEVFVGCRPKKSADFDELRQHGIRTIISYESFPWHVAPERQKAQKNGFAFVNAPVFASPFGPSEKSIKRALRVLNDQSLRPVYVHCLYGRDRTAMILGLYRIYYQAASPQEVWDEMIRSGYKSDWSLWGFKRYFWKHTNKPDWAFTP